MIKISGVLIEFIIKNKIIRHTIIGLGLNVNQIFFQNLPNATSMKLVLNKSTCLDKLRTKFLEKLKYYFSLKNNQDISIIILWRFQPDDDNDDKGTNFKIY